MRVDVAGIFSSRAIFFAAIIIMSIPNVSEDIERCDGSLEEVLFSLLLTSISLVVRSSFL